MNMRSLRMNDSRCDRTLRETISNEKKCDRSHEADDRPSGVMLTECDRPTAKDG